MSQRIPVLLVGLCAVLIGAPVHTAPSIDSTDLARAREMLGAIRIALRSHFHDPTFGGRDLDALFKAARERLAGAQSVDEAYDIVGAALDSLGDSHTYFIPPIPAYEFDHGWEMAPVGEECYVSAVQPGSDAAAKGLQPGDRVLDVNGEAEPRRGTCSLRHARYLLMPRPALGLVLQRPGEAPRAVSVDAARTLRRSVAVTPENVYGVLALERQRKFRASRTVHTEGIRVWRLPSFDFEPPEMGRAAHQALDGAAAVVLDLRGNGGGSVEALVELTRYFFTRRVHMAQARGRGRGEAIEAAGRKQAFEGPLIVLVDGATASAAEIFARVIQIEQRGIIVGDRTAGCVRQSRIRTAVLPVADGVLTYGVSIAEADILMRDGRSLEGTGVIPDVPRIPAVDDLAHRRDPVLAHAMALLGGSVDAAAAARLFDRRD